MVIQEPVQVEIFLLYSKRAPQNAVRSTANIFLSKEFELPFEVKR